ncbi:hypothetical protein M422DRAFT_53545 [Sphaerobolus stellatus SS14]|uniref:Uncharacterized protein n=1 Tax=Sphaerobolus stellatus (strain SS14) TaxID=990650 RepID=A0A0C9TM45_SPHS4|nr:hypothetical protein M422DRAFT_53545 [Sphaerobolus stellatus SS14]
MMIRDEDSISTVSSSEAKDALEVSQEIYDDIADRLGEQYHCRLHGSSDSDSNQSHSSIPDLEPIHINAMTVKDRGDELNFITAPEQNMVRPKNKDMERLLPKSPVIPISINGHPARALIDTGSTLGRYFEATYHAP